MEESEQLEINVQEQIQAFQEELEKQRKKESEQSTEVSERELETEKMLQRQDFHKQNVERIDG